jgi:hypothetical protein
MASGLRIQVRVLPSTSVNKNVTVPLGNAEERLRGGTPPQ